MQVDHLAGAHALVDTAPTQNEVRAFADCRMSRIPRILVFDSGLGGLTVFAEIARAVPEAHFTYVADDAGFPYGRLNELALVARVTEVMTRLTARHAPDVAVIACNTASTLVLPGLRKRFPRLTFVGTVPAIKPAAFASRSRMFSVLATPGTVARDYTRELIREFASDCDVTLVGSANLATLAEGFMQGGIVSDAMIREEIAPCFVEADGRRTDTIVLGCTHFPLLLKRFRAIAPWTVTWIDPAPAIARRVASVLRDELGFAPPTRRDEANAGLGEAFFTSGTVPGDSLQNALRDRGLTALDCAPMPLLLA
jgi:glutamate racemase